MNIILLSGGSGKRLWPLSNDTRSKQFLKIFRRADGTKESMVQRMYRMIKQTDPDASVTIATSASQIPQIKAQLGEEVNISVEPARRDTFPAIALAAACLKKQNVKEDEPVVICPIDPYVEQDYFECLKEMADRTNKANLTLMGITPTGPSGKYGYIIPQSDGQYTFKEKPDPETAEAYIRQGALWNAGIFACRLSYLLQIIETKCGTTDEATLQERYETLPKISFDREVVEQETALQVIRFSGSWKDLGTWNTLTEAMDEEFTGNTTARACANTHIINELSIPVIALGVKDSVIAATPDGILVADKANTSGLKDLLTDTRPMYERRGWGEYRVLDYKTHPNKDNSLVKELVITPGQHISYHRHRRRTEDWTVTEGTGELIINGKTQRVARGDTVTIPAQTNHAIKAITELHIIEVQIGDELTEDDIERLDWDWTE